MSEEKQHARLSPSGAHGWLNCPGWESDKTGSKYADEGTAAHLLASCCLTMQKPAAAYLGRVISVNGHDFVVDEEMAEPVQRYVDKVIEYAGSVLPSGEVRLIHSLLIEQAVPIDHVTGEEGAEGTSDAIILTNDGEIQVHDLKFGQGERVDAEENPQLMLYALGALRLVEEFLGEKPNRVRCVIHQPRINQLSEWDCSVDQLRAFAAHAAQAAAYINGGNTMLLAPGAVNVVDKPLTPGQKQCRWCAHRATCDARRAFLEEQTALDFTALPDPVETAAPTDDAKLDALYPHLDHLEDFVRAVRARIEARLFAGAKFESCKLVEGKRGARAWSDEKEAESTLKSMRLKVEEMYTFKLLSPTQAEKLLKDSPKRWERVKSLISQSQGKPSVAPITDKRPALVVGKTEDDFESLT